MLLKLKCKIMYRLYELEKLYHEEKAYVRYLLGDRSSIPSTGESARLIHHQKCRFILVFSSVLMRDC